MGTSKMHADEIEIDVDLVRQLIADQMPEWAGHAIHPVESAGTDNALFRLGPELVVRFPRIHRAVEQVKKEQRWLPRLAPSLPLRIPHPLAIGAPGFSYPWPWSVYTWIDGENPADATALDLERAAGEMAAFLRALRGVDPTGGPLPGSHNSGRGAPLQERDEAVRAAIAALGGEIAADAVEKAWRCCLAAPRHRSPHVWIHGDLQPGNLLVAGGQITAVIDFGCLGVGDPACDLLLAWNLFDGRIRRVFRAALGVDDAEWERGRGWALSMGLIALPYYRDTNPVLAAHGRKMIDEALADP